MTTATIKVERVLDTEHATILDPPPMQQISSVYSAEWVRDRDKGNINGGFMVYSRSQHYTPDEQLIAVHHVGGNDTFFYRPDGEFVTSVNVGIFHQARILSYRSMIALFNTGVIAEVDIYTSIRTKLAEITDAQAVKQEHHAGPMHEYFPIQYTNMNGTKRFMVYDRIINTIRDKRFRTTCDPFGKWVRSGLDFYEHIGAAWATSPSKPNVPGSYGHDCWAYLADGSPVWFAVNNSAPEDFFYFNPETGQHVSVATMRDIHYEDLPDGTLAVAGMHPCAYTDGWVALATYSSKHTAEDFWAIDQILLLELKPRDQNPRLVRVGHTNNRYTGDKYSGYYSEAHMSKGPGDSLLLTSNNMMTTENIVYKIDLPEGWDKEGGAPVPEPEPAPEPEKVYMLPVEMQNKTVLFFEDGTERIIDHERERVEER